MKLMSGNNPTYPLSQPIILPGKRETLAGAKTGPQMDARGARPHLPGGVQSQLQQAIHRQAKAPVNPPNWLLTLQRTFWAHEKAFTDVTANFSL